jgi:hypothetical protein
MSRCPVNLNVSNIRGLLEKYPTLFFLCEHLMDYNLARLHERASNNGGTAGRSVWSPKGTTLRVIRCPTLQVRQFPFPGQRSDTFLTDHVYHHNLLNNTLYANVLLENKINFNFRHTSRKTLNSPEKNSIFLNNLDTFVPHSFRVWTVRGLSGEPRNFVRGWGVSTN